MPVNRRAWTDGEIAILRKHPQDPKAAYSELISVGLGRSFNSVESRYKTERRIMAKEHGRQLAEDIARCIGIEKSDGTLDAQCHDCKRRTDRSTFPLQVWMAPVEDRLCEFRIGKDKA